MGVFVAFFVLPGFLVSVMTFAWVVQRVSKNAGWVDVIWTFGTGLAGVIAAFSSGFSGRTVLAAVLVGVWALRLGIYILLRTHGMEHEDVRYARYRKEWGAAFNRRMFGLLMVQAIAAWPLADSVGFAAANKLPLGVGEATLGVLVAAVAIGGEGLSDAQMHRFRRNPANKGKVCDVGMWAWSRHPNYFFEWLYWLTYPILAVTGFWPLGFIAFAAPVVMYLLLTRLSGVPMLEREMLESRGDAYRNYQSRVPAFFPFPKTRKA